MSNTSSPPPGVAPSTRELGLDLALIAARYFFKTDHLHYGLWTPDLPVHMNNLKQAQENYSDMLAGMIPAGTKTILDVGMGTGTFAKRLTDEGYDVECVSPSPYLTQQGRAILGDKHVIHECKYEDLKTDKKYDLILFSESYQYIDLKTGLALTNDLLKPGGHLLICDYFRNETPDKGPFGGGHLFKDFWEQIKPYPFTVLVDEDITKLTSPNLDMVADFVEQVFAPIKERLFNFAAYKYPIPYRTLTWMFRKPLAQFNEKYMTGKRRGKNFEVYKTYHRLLFVKGPQPKAVTPP